MDDAPFLFVLSDNARQVDDSTRIYDKNEREKCGKTPAKRPKHCIRKNFFGFCAQSAMEYLMTYGWAILIIAVVLGALYYLGVFNSSNFAPRAQPGSCKVIRPLGPGTTSYINLGGVCTGQLPQFVGSFDGKSSYVDLSNPTSLNPTSQITVSVWTNFKSTNPSNNGQYIIAREHPVSPWSAYYISLDTDNVIRGLIRNSAGTGNTVNFLAVTSSNFNTWYNFILTYDGSTITGYLNGVNVGTHVQSGNIFAATLDTTIGAWAAASTNTVWNGLISNVQIYNTSLDAGAVQSLYAKGIGGAPISPQYLVGWWPLNGNANDYSGNNNNGVPTNVAFTSTWTR